MITFTIKNILTNNKIHKKNKCIFNTYIYIDKEM